MQTGCARLLLGGSMPAALPPGPWRALYVWQGHIVARRGAEAEETLPAGQACLLDREAVALQPREARTRYWLWEVAADAAAPDAELPRLEERLRHDLAAAAGGAGAAAHGAGATDGPGAVCLRLERVDLAPAAVTPRHTHAGCGLRALLCGSIEAEIGGRRLSIRPGDAWLERGPGEDVVGRADPTAPTAFVRLMVLPPDMVGRDSYVPWDATAAQRPRPARYQRFFDERVTL